MEPIFTVASFPGVAQVISAKLVNPRHIIPILNLWLEN